MFGAFRTTFIGASRLAEDEPQVSVRTAKTLSAYGDAKFKEQEWKFGGVSASFDGASDAIKVTSGLTDFEGSGDFTYEFWIRSANIGGRFAVVDQRHTSNSAATFNIFFWDGNLQMYQNGFASLGGTWSNNTWYHVAITKTGSTYKGYQDGTLIGTWSSGASTIPTVGEFNIALANDEVNWDYNGYLDEIRVSDTVRYTSNFTSPTEPFVNDANTLLLIHCDGFSNNTEFYDDVGVRAPINPGVRFDGEYSTAQFKFGSSSWYQDNENAGFKLPYTDPFDSIGTGDFTFEAWVRRDSNSNAPMQIWHSNNEWALRYNNHNSNSQLEYLADNGDTVRITGSSLSKDVWYHVAVSRSSGTTKMFINGTQSGSDYSDDRSFVNNSEYLIGVDRNGGNGWRGYIDEVRFSNVARYTGNFTAPADAFENDDDTMLLWHMEGANGGTSSIFDDNEVVQASTLAFRSDTYASNVVLAVPFDEEHGMDDQSEEINSGSTQATLTDGPASTLSTNEVKWTSSPDYVNSYLGTMGVGQANTYALSTSIPGAGGATSYVVEGWFNASNATSNSNWCLSSADSGGRWLFGINNGSTFSFGNENNIGIGSGWHHLAIVSESASKRFYYDGIYKGAWVTSNSGFSTLHVGQFNAGDPNDFRGHIQDLKVTIGSNRGYTGTNSSSANFTLPGSIVESY